ncbi:uncharacterized protein JCM6883_000916 [Sporobolomyces salmoneus]|uniref:uncharacterized protein n=1 Tax=Sporobolomyces salmoneus TaxID=183962 RepID=UPI00317C8955
MPYSRIDGLNELTTQNDPSPSSFADQIPNQWGFEELLRAQVNLDAWASTVFSTASPGSLPTPLQSEPSSSLTASLASPSSTPLEMSTAELPFDWSTLYPQLPPASIPTGVPHNPLPQPFPMGLPDFASTQSDFSRSLSSLPPQHTNLPSLQHVSQDSNPSSRAPSPQPSIRKSRSRRASKAPSQSASDGGQGSDTLSLGSRELMSREEIEEDKRRRNTEASARFRAKKKMRNVALQQTAAELREKVTQLEKEKDALTSQNRWLRDIIREKTEVNPRPNAA